MSKLSEVELISSLSQYLFFPPLVLFIFLYHLKLLVSQKFVTSIMLWGHTPGGGLLPLSSRSGRSTYSPSAILFIYLFGCLPTPETVLSAWLNCSLERVPSECLNRVSWWTQRIFPCFQWTLQWLPSSPTILLCLLWRLLKCSTFLSQHNIGLHSGFTPSFLPQAFLLSHGF